MNYPYYVRTFSKLQGYKILQRSKYLSHKQKNFEILESTIHNGMMANSTSKKRNHAISWRNGNMFSVVTSFPCTRNVISPCQEISASWGPVKFSTSRARCGDDFQAPETRSVSSFLIRILVLISTLGLAALPRHFPPSARHPNARFALKSSLSSEIRAKFTPDHASISHFTQDNCFWFTLIKFLSHHSCQWIEILANFPYFFHFIFKSSLRIN